MDNKAYYQAVYLILRDQRPFEIRIPIVDAWNIISACQLAMRTSGVSAMGSDKEIRPVVERMEKAIVNRHPETATAFKLQWNQIDTPLDPDKFKILAGVAIADSDPVVIDLRMSGAWWFVVAVQIAVRHPAMEAKMHDSLIDIARQVQNGLKEDCPAAVEALEMGWDAANDNREVNPDEFIEAINELKAKGL